MRDFMIKFYLNRELSEKLDIRLSKWKRWSREFLPPDPLGGMQSGYARQYTIDQAFTVFLGGHLVADLHFSIPEAKQIGKELSPWINRHKKTLTVNAAERKVEDIQVYIFKQLPSPSEGRAFVYLERICLSDEPHERADPHTRHAVYTEKPIPVASSSNGVDKSDRLNKIDSRILYASRLYDRFMSRMTGREKTERQRTEPVRSKE
jgi:hypothetical protein